jgi:membrane-associated phospholipid phosphatase
MVIAATRQGARRQRDLWAVVLGPSAGLLAAGFLLLVAALTLSAIVRWHPGPLPGDVEITLAWQRLVRPHPWPTEVIGAVSRINFPRPARYLTVAVVVALALCRRWFDIAVALGTLWLAGTTTHRVNLFVERPRPAGLGIFVNRYIADVYSFPSGHVSHALVFMGLVAFFTLRVRSTHPPISVALWLVRLYLLTQAILMAPSRVLEGEHWPSDVLGGLLFGGFWLLAGIAAYTWAVPRWPHLVPPNERKGDALTG